MSQISLLSSIKPLTAILQLTAFMLFTIDSKTGKIKYTKLNFFIALTAIIFQFIIHYVFWISCFDFIFVGTEVFKNGIPKLIYANLTTYGLTKVWLFIKRHEIAEMIQNLSNIDEKLSEIGCKIDYKEDRKSLTILILSIVLIIITMFIFAFVIMRTILTESNPIISIFHIESFTSFTLIILQVLLTLFSIKRRFEIINSQISTKNLKKLAEIHLETTTLIENFNEIFGFVMLLCTAIVFGWFCMFVFSIVMVSSQLIHFPFLMAFDTIVNVIIIGTFVTIIYFAECAKNEGRKTIKLLYMELHKIEDQKLCSNFQNFIHQIVITKNEFSCRLFDLSWTFLFKFLTTVAMYFVILVQFESSFKKDK